MTVDEQMARGGLERMVYEGNDRLTDRDATRTSLSAAMTSARTAATAAALTTLGLAAASWVVALRQMNGMDMGVETELGSFAFFVALWLSMMAAMMLPGAVPAVSRFVRVDGRLLAAPLFAGSYLVVWTIVGLVVYALYQPHGTFVAGVLTVAAGVYELTPLKRGCRRRCRQSVRSGFEFGILLRRLEHRFYGDAAGARRHERHLDGRRCRPHPRPEAPTAAGDHRRAARGGDRGHRNSRRRRAVVDPRSHQRDVTTGRRESE
jgi:hypothetical protein